MNNINYNKVIVFVIIFISGITAGFLMSSVYYNYDQDFIVNDSITNNNKSENIVDKNKNKKYFVKNNISSNKSDQQGKNVYNDSKDSNKKENLLDDTQ